MEEIKMGIGLRLKVLLEEKNINVKELAKKIDITPSTIYSMINRDSKKADIDIFLALCSALKVKPEYFASNNSAPVVENPEVSSFIKYLRENNYDVTEDKEYIAIRNYPLPWDGTLYYDNEHEAIRLITLKKTELKRIIPSITKELKHKTNDVITDVIYKRLIAPLEHALYLSQSSKNKLPK